MIADDLKALFDSKNLSNRQVAKLSGISESSISRILRKETEDPGFQTIAHLVKTVGGSLDVMTGIASATDPVVALKASYDALLASRGELLAEKDKEIAHREATHDSLVVLDMSRPFCILYPDGGFICF